MKFYAWILTGLLLYPFLATGQTSTEVLTLDDCIRIALDNNYNLNFAKLDNQVAKKTYTQSYSGILPQVNVFYGQGKYERGPSSYLGNDYIGVNPALPFTFQKTVGRNYYGQLRINQTLFDGGRWWLDIKKAKYDKLSSDYNFLSTRQNIIVTVRQLYMDLLKQEELLEVTRQAVERSKEQLERIKSMHEVGSVAQIDVFRSRVNLGNDRIEMLNQENTVRKARHSLNIALGRDPNAPLQIDKNVHFEKKLGELNDQIQKALANNPDIKAQVNKVKSAKYQLRQAKSAFLPNVSASYFYQRRVPQFDGIYKDLDREYYWEIGFNISWNLFNGFSDALNVQKAKLGHRYEQQKLEYDRLQLKSKVSYLSDDLKAFNEFIDINKENLESAQEDYRLAQERYRLGSGTILDLREAQVNLATAEQLLIAARFNAYITYAEIQKALGELVGEK